jgi:hypothetical protein
MSRSNLCLALSGLLLLAGCPTKKSAGNPVGNLGGKDCDPMVPQQCGFPFPSSVYLSSDSSTSSGRRVTFGAGTLPPLNGTPADPTSFQDMDGFSAGQAPMTFLPGAVATGLPTQADDLLASGMPLSLQVGSSPTLLLEDPKPEDTSVAPTPVLHFAELDVNGQAGIDQALMIRPLVRLKDNTRYIVAIRHVQDNTGAVIPPSDVFKALRDGSSSSDSTVASRRDLYTNILAKLKAAGVSTSDLQIAWDYYTASKESNTSQLVSMRDQALAALPASGPTFSILYSSDNPDAVTGRRIFGTVHVPLFLDHGAIAIDASTTSIDTKTGFTLQRDSSGKPTMNGFADYDFIVNVPKSVFQDTVGAPTLIQGHGLFSDRSEGLDANSISSSGPGYGFTLQLANDHKYVTITLDLIGWRQVPDSTPSKDYQGYPADWATAYPNGDPNQEDDKEKALGILNEDIGAFRGMVDRGTQGIVNELVAVKMMETSLAADSHMKAADGHSFIDTTQSYYRGDSQGGILGATFMALSQTCKRGYLGEAGMPYNLLLMRSEDFAQFLQLLQLNYMSAMNVQIIGALVQMFWDRLEPNGFAPYITSSDPNGLLPNTPSHNVLINDGVGDFQVTPLGSHLLARTVGAEALIPALRPIYGISPASSASFMGNGILEYDFGVATTAGVTIPTTDQPPSCNNNGDDCSGRVDPHDKIRVLTATESETDTFLKTGNAQSYCTSGGEPSTCVFSEQ